MSKFQLHISSFLSSNSIGWQDAQHVQYFYGRKNEKRILIIPEPEIQYIISDYKEMIRYLF